MPKVSGKYAVGTEVSSEVTRLEIERTLIRYGASAFMYAISPGRALLAFELAGRRMRFLVPLPDRRGADIVYTPERRLVRSQPQQQAAYEQAIRQRWRALLLVIKAKLEAVDAGITTIEDEFLSAVVLPDDTTVGERMLPELGRIARTGDLPPLLPAPAPVPR